MPEKEAYVEEVAYYGAEKHEEYVYDEYHELLEVRKKPPEVNGEEGGDPSSVRP